MRKPFEKSRLKLKNRKKIKSTLSSVQAVSSPWKIMWLGLISGPHVQIIILQLLLKKKKKLRKSSRYNTNGTVIFI